MYTEKYEKIELIKKYNPTLKKLHRYRNSNSFFDTPFEIYSDDLSVSSSYIFDDLNNTLEFHKFLGKGAFGSVKKAVLVNSGETVAIKIQNLTRQIEYHSKTLGDEVKARDYVKRQIETEDTLLKLTGQYISSLERTNIHKQEKHYSIIKFIEGDPFFLSFRHKKELHALYK